MICIYPFGNQNEYCFGIFDAKYYLIDFKKQKDKYKVVGQPGISDIIKQYIYQLAYGEFIMEQGYKYVKNVFLCPQEDAEINYGYVELKMLHKIGDKTLENIAVVKLCAEEMFRYYLSGKRIKNIASYIPHND